MKDPNFLEAGRIVSTHGVRGEVKIQSYCDSAEFLLDFDAFYIDGQKVQVRAARVHKGQLLAYLEQIEDIDAAARLRGKLIYIDRRGIQLNEGQYFIADLLGLTVLDVDTGKAIGTLTEVSPLPAGDVYTVKGEQTYLIPARGGFVENVDLDAGTMQVHLIEGLAL